ncbi:MAG: ASPIC/UnbV domain-containing protein, partial [Phycisphaerales bacterium JB039]
RRGPVLEGSVAAACGFDDTDWGMGLIALDVDRDGWLDVLQACNEPGPLRLRRCMPEPPASANHWLVVRPRMEGPNTRAIGAVVRVTTSSGTRMRQITAGTSVLSQEPPEAHFGLGADDTVRELVIEWPGGGVSVRRNLAPDQIIDILRTGCPADVNADGALDFFDFLEFLNLFARQDPRADVDQDGAFTALDFQTFQSDFVGGCR